MKRTIDIFALIFIIIGAVNWGLAGLFQLDVISWFFDGINVTINRIIYVIVIIAGIWCINLIAIQSRRRTDVRFDSRLAE